MLSGLVIQPPDHLLATISLDQIATIVASSRKVLVEQLQVAIIAKDKFLTLLPPNSNRDDVVAAIPNGVWDQGYKIYTYSPLMDTSISIPMFKLWIDIEGVPPELLQEVHMARAISSFGCYLGSLEPRTHGDCRSWSVFLATDDLALVPHQLEFRIGGIVYTANIRPRKWTRGQVYQRSDLPPSPIAYHQAPSKFDNPQLASKTPSAPDPLWFQGDDVMHMSLRAMREIFRNFDPSELPPDLAECLAGNPAAIKVHNDAGRAWEQQVACKGKAVLTTGTCSTDATSDPTQYATVDPNQVNPSPCSARQSRLHTSRSSSQVPLASPEVIPPAEATVHRTELRVSRGKRTQADLALQVCTSHSFVNLGEDVHPWEPRDLFPEINSPPTHPINPSEHNDRSEPSRKPPQSPPRRSRRTFSNRIGKKKSGDGIVLDIDMQAFVDVPLQHAEGTELLALIGASHVPIPSHLMLSSQQQMMGLEKGQPSMGPTKKVKQPGPSARDEAPRLTQGDSPMDPDEQQGLDLGDFGLMDVAVGFNEHEAADPEEDPYIDRVDYSDDDPLI